MDPARSLPLEPAADRDGTFTRGKDSRGNTAGECEVRFGELREHDFRAGSTRRQAAGARLKKEALDRMELAYYETALLPYARPNGVYARAR